jgi:palmitoyl-protein thioesterase
MINYFVKRIAYSSITQHILAPANFFRDNANYDAYLSSALLLPELNNEKPHAKFSENKRRFTSLNAYMLVWFTGDTVVNPKESEKFGEHSIDGTNIIDMKDTQVYKSDAFGLKTMDEARKLTIIEMAGGHLNFDSKTIKDLFVPFLMK